MRRCPEWKNALHTQGLLRHGCKDLATRCPARNSRLFNHGHKHWPMPTPLSSWHPLVHKCRMQGASFVRTRMEPRCEDRNLESRPEGSGSSGLVTRTRS
eukprot:10306701-Alexandrium_andersonii.AAC.1